VRKQVLAACPPSALPTIERLLGSHVALIAAHSLEAAQQALQRNAELAMVVCGIHFDESRMYELLEYTRQHFPSIPFISVRILDTKLPPISRHSIAIATQSRGAVAYVDFADAAAERGQEAADAYFVTTILQHLPSNQANP
jgi:hypothetical protein